MTAFTCVVANLSSATGFTECRTAGTLRAPQARGLFDGVGAAGFHFPFDEVASMSTALLRGLLPALFMACAPALALAAAPAAPPLEDFLARDSFSEITVSPDGRFLAASAPLEKGGALIVLDRETLERRGHFYAGSRIEVLDFWWASPERLVFTVGEKFDGLERPGWTGELYAMDADGGAQLMLAGQRAGGGGTGSNIKGRRAERIAAYPIDFLPDSERRILVSVAPIGGSSDPFTAVERMDVYTGARKGVASVPVQRASFVTDPKGEVRFAIGAGVENETQLYYRADADSEWVLINDEGESGQVVAPLGFNVDGSVAYLQSSRASGPDAIESFDPVTRERSEIFRHSRVDPASVIESFDGRAVLGVALRTPRREAHFFVQGSAEEKLWRSLSAAFEGQDVEISSVSADGRWAVVQTRSDRNPGDFYMFDREAKRASHIGSRAAGIDPDALGETRALQVKARDGMELEALLTLPPGTDGRGLPLVVHPHGGPFDVRDIFGYDPQVQILATRGYAVLQVNFRGSGGYGRSFMLAGYRQWGRAMQDDLTDATRYVIEQGIADPERICTFGASYGGYASLMAVAKEPDLYACAVGYVGVYDLPMMYKNGDIPQRGSGKNYLKDAVGSEGLEETSPARLAANITAPVLLVAGGADERTPIEQTYAMERALKAAGRPPQTLYKRTEGHGFYEDANRLEFQQTLLTFLDRHIGSGSKAAAPAAGE
jgi:dipeptidyl aminopeptidase/acylaminoacyl peptidase